MLNSKAWLLFVVGALIVVMGIPALKDWIQPAPIQIIVQHRRQLPRQESVLPVISFKFQKDYRLTRVRVLSTAESTTNKYAAPYWELVGESASPATNFVLYGFEVAGMSVRTAALPLENGESYRILVEAGRRQGSAEFIP